MLDGIEYGDKPPSAAVALFEELGSFLSIGEGSKLRESVGVIFDSDLVRSGEGELELIGGHFINAAGGDNLGLALCQGGVVVCKPLIARWARIVEIVISDIGVDRGSNDEWNIAE